MVLRNLKCAGPAGIREEQQYQADFRQPEKNVWVESGFQDRRQRRKHPGQREDDGRSEDGLFKPPRDQRNIRTTATGI